MLDIDEARARAAEGGVPEMMGDLNVFRVLLHDPASTAAINGLLHRLLWKGDLDQRLRELVIMRIGWVSGAVYEWTQHWHVALALGVDGTWLAVLIGAVVTVVLGTGAVAMPAPAPRFPRYHNSAPRAPPL